MIIFQLSILAIYNNMNSKIIIRDFEKQDLKKVIKITEESHEYPDNISKWSKKELEKYIPLMKYFLVAEINGQVVGYIDSFSDDSRYDSEWFNFFIGKKQENNWNNFLYLDQVAIDKQFRRKGVMTKLIETLLNKAQRDFEIICSSYRSNPKNIPSEKYFNKKKLMKIDIIKTKDNAEYQMFIIR